MWGKKHPNHIRLHNVSEIHSEYRDSYLLVVQMKYIKTSHQKVRIAFCFFLVLTLGLFVQQSLRKDIIYNIYM